MKRWIGLLGSWALFVLALGLAAFTIAGESINMTDERRLDRVAAVDRMIAERTGSKASELRDTATQKTARVNVLQAKLQDVARQTDDVPDTGQTILVSTAENKLYVRRNGQTVFEAVCSTGKGTTLAVDGKTIVFDTPIGKLHIISKDENPQWVPPDWHYVEEARKNGMRVVRLDPGQSIDARTGQPASARSDHGVWSWLNGGNSRSNNNPILRVRGDTIVEVSNGVERELEPGKSIVAGDAIIVPPVNTKQRHYDKVLGKFRLEMGNGYGIHGTDEPDKLGQSVSHGCVRLGDADIEKLYSIANVGDTVIIY
ncbi:MAG TPA: L,D-transpeptidase family protein [Thermoanaerobaculia bacterium]|jgi:lipoprotein-anchoring transpeptidase ErfK/SrfK|nr:L,D-transpeptidase family protein [Thermoanaerobaculia bacterium]